MRDDERMRSAIGFAQKAGKLASGDSVVERLSRAGGAKLLLLDTDASENTKKKYALLAKASAVTLTYVRELGACIGKPSRMTAVVTDNNFANMILRAQADAGDAKIGGNG